MRQFSAAGEPLRSRGGDKPVRVNLDQVLRFEVRQGNRLLPVIQQHNRRVWSGLSWAVGEVAAAQHVPLLELRRRTVELEQSLGPEGSKALHLYLPAGRYDAYPKGAKDDTHYNESGARRVAALAAQEIRGLGLPLAQWLRDASPD